MASIGFARAWGDYLLDLAIKGFSSDRYLSAHKLRGTPPRRAGRRGHLPGATVGKRDPRPGRYSRKRVVGAVGY